MATARIPILGFGTNPDSSGNAYFEPSSVVFGDTDAYQQLLLALLTPAADLGVYGSFRVPEDYASAPVLVVDWACVATSGNFGIGLICTPVAAGEDFDPAAATADVTTDAAAGTARLLSTHSLTLTNAGTFAARDQCPFYFFRDDSGDTIAATVWVAGLYFEYTTT